MLQMLFQCVPNGDLELKCASTKNNNRNKLHCIHAISCHFDNGMKLLEAFLFFGVSMRETVNNTCHAKLGVFIIMGGELRRNEQSSGHRRLP